VKRVFLVVLDSLGVGALPDAKDYGDQGANTLGHILERIPVALPNMAAMGLGIIPGIDCHVPQNAAGAVGRAMEASAGKDTTTGHWEIMGLILSKPFPIYADGFPADVIEAFENAIGRNILCNCPASGTAILDELGEEHMKTGFPIVYTSADSVFQIACHEEVVPVKTLYQWCETARELLQGDHAVGRVIARPFTGTGRGAFHRTERRRDFSLPPTGKTLLDAMAAKDLFTMGIGKIEDIFCMRGIKESNHAAGNKACLDVLLETMKRDFTGLVFVNLVDFDMLFGHRRDVPGYAKALEYFDGRLAEIRHALAEGDLLLLTADHGCDPAHSGTDHTREYVPILAWRPGMKSISKLGTRKSFGDIAATVAELFGMSERFGAVSFASRLE